MTRLGLMLLLMVSGCGDDTASPDAGTDASRDAASDSSVPDAPDDSSAPDSAVRDAMADSVEADDVGVDSAVPTRNVVDVRWSADSLEAEVPAGRTCTLDNAFIDTEVFSEGTASMRLESPVGDVQGSMGCDDFGQTDLSIEWNSGQWLCMYFDMRVDSAFNWDRNQRKFKMQRMVNSGRWTMYLNEDGVDISECSTCDTCAGGDRCTVMSYDMRPAAAGGVNPVESWQSYTIGIRMESASGADDGAMKLWVDGVLVDEIDGQTYCASCSGTMRGAWGTFGMNPYPQSPDGTLWLDDFVLMSGPDECAPRP